MNLVTLSVLLLYHVLSVIDLAECHYDIGMSISVEPTLVYQFTISIVSISFY